MTGRRLVGRLPPSIWSIVDHGLASGTLFVVSVVLGRVLEPVDYGAFSVAYAVLAGLMVAHTAFVSEPLLVFGPEKYRAVFRSYVRVLGRLQWTFGAAAAMTLSLVGVLLFSARRPALGGAFLGAGATIPFYALSVLGRRAFYALQRPGVAAAASATMLAISIAALLLLHITGQLSGFAGFLPILLSCGIVGATLWIMARRTTSAVDVDHADVRRDHWRYGTWGLLATALTWIAGNIMLLVLPLRGGLGDAAAFRAVMNIVTPFLQVNAALGVVLLPRLAAAPRLEAATMLRRYVAGVTILSVAAWILLATVGRSAVRTAYAGRYDDVAWLLLLLGSIPLFEGLTYVIGSALRAMREPQRAASALAWSAGTALTVGVGLTLAFGLTGATIGLALTSLTSALAHARQYREAVAS